MATTLFEDLLKEKPDVPVWKDIDPTQVQSETVSGNIATLAGAKKLATQYNQFMAESVTKQLKTAVPEFDPLQKQMAANLGAQLRGELTSSDVAASQRSSAAAALGLGIAGSGAGGAFSARNLGLRQYQVQQAAQAQTPAWLQTAAALTKAPVFDLSSMFYSPQQRLQAKFENQTNAWNVNWLNNQIKAQPSGWAWALAKQGDADLEMVKQAAVSYFSGGLGGMGGGGGGGGENYRSMDFSAGDAATIAKYRLG